MAIAANLPAAIECAVPSEGEYIAAVTKIEDCARAAREKGFTPRMSGAQGAQGKRFTISIAGASLTVRIETKTKRPQAVTETSRAAYRAIDKDSAVEKYLRAAISIGGRFSDADVAAKLDWPSSSVSGRRNDVQAKEAVVDGKVYRVVLDGKKQDPKSGHTVRAYRVEIAGEPATLFG